MRAAYVEAFTGTSGVRVGEVPEPAREPGDVLVRVRAASLNHHDVYTARGEAGRFQPPVILGSDSAGVVLEGSVPEAGIVPGSRVAIYPVVHCGNCVHCAKGWEHKCFSFGMVGGERPGTLAERIAVPARNLVSIPDRLSDEIAGTISVAALTAWNMVHDEGAVESGEVVLVLGASGGVGVYAIRFLRNLRARVIAVTSKADKAEYLRSCGADTVVVGDAAAVLAVTARLPAKGVDAAINYLGGASWRYVLPAVRKGGRVLTCGAVGGAIAEFDQRQVFYRHLRIIGCTMGSRSAMKAMIERLAQNPEIGVPPTEECALDQVPDVLKRMEEGGARGKVLIRP